MKITIGNITGEVVRAAGSWKAKEAKAEARRDRRSNPVRAENERVRQHEYKTGELARAVTDAEKRLEILRLNQSELDAKSIKLEDLAFRTGVIQPDARNVEFDRVQMRPMIARAVENVAMAQATLKAHKGEAASEIIADHDAELHDEPAEPDVDSSPKRGRPRKVEA